MREARVVIRSIGYWRGSGDSDLPDPADFIDVEGDDEEFEVVADYLESGVVPVAAAGLSPCRLCGRPNGSAEMTDGVFWWPEGLAHYVRDHRVRLPAAVVEHALASVGRSGGEHLDVAQLIGSIDDAWWLEQTTSATDEVRRSRRGVADGSAPSSRHGSL